METLLIVTLMTVWGVTNIGTLIGAISTLRHRDRDAILGILGIMLFSLFVLSTALHVVVLFSIP